VYQAAKIYEIKVEAGRRINAQYPLATGKQSNMLARNGELAMKIATGGFLTAAESTESATLQQAWEWIKAVRSASQSVEAAILAATTPAGVDAAVAAVTWPTTIPPEWPL
jgi:hypothetical protein